MLISCILDSYSLSPGANLHQSSCSPNFFTRRLWAGAPSCVSLDPFAILPPSLSFRQILEQRALERDIPKYLDHEFLIRKKLLRDDLRNLVQGTRFNPFIEVELFSCSIVYHLNESLSAWLLHDIKEAKDSPLPKGHRSLEPIQNILQFLITNDACTGTGSYPRVKPSSFKISDNLTVRRLLIPIGPHSGDERVGISVV